MEKIEKVDKRQLINVKMDNGDVVPIGNSEDYELIVDEDGIGTIQLKEEK